MGMLFQWKIFFHKKFENFLNRKLYIILWKEAPHGARNTKVHVNNIAKQFLPQKEKKDSLINTGIRKKHSFKHNLHWKGDCPEEL